MHSARPIVASRRSELIRLGWTDRELKRAVAEGRLLKPRANAYLLPGTDPDLIDACALGGRLTCVSELARHGIFVLERETLHLHFHETRDLAPKTSRRMRRHWGRPRRAPHPSALALELFDALRESVRCQTPRAAIATLDSVLHLGLLRADDLDELFATLPRRYGVIRSLVDERCESGPESLLRLILRTLGVSFEVQVIIPRVGRVDFVVDGWLIVECDSFEHHSSWEAQRRDRRRDQAAAALGYATYRPIAEDIMWRPDEVRAALTGLLRGRTDRRAR